jgi:outer membrane protein assembly factor BamB
MKTTISPRFYSGGCQDWQGWGMALTWLVWALTIGSSTIVEAQAASAGDQSTLGNQVLKSVGHPRGVCALIGIQTTNLALELAARSELLIYVQLADDKEVDVFRRVADARGFYGTRLFVEKGKLDQLHLGDNLADALVDIDPALNTPAAEVLRVLRPQGKAFLKDRELVKPTPAGVDDWSHPYHGPDNNPASRDLVAKAPYLTQFLADPRYAPLPQVAVASAGRVFKIFGHIAFKEREEPWLNTMAAFNGYNGAFLWRRPVPPGLMVHRNTFIATPGALYFGDHKSCQVIDADTGQLRDEIVVPADVAGGTFWKWMALADGVLYALIGDEEPRDPTIRMRSDRHGWPWDPLSPGYNQTENAWGYGRTLLAIAPETKKILWRHQETEAIDSRALCLKNGRLFLFRPGAFLACLDTRTGRELWRQTRDQAPALFAAMGPTLNRQDWRTNWRTASYFKCSDQAIYVSGPTISKLLALSAADGHRLWEHPYNNYQLVLQDDALYALSGQIDNEVSRKFEPLTGKILQEVKLGRRACTRPTGAIDAVFCRASGGSTRWDRDSDRVQLISPMRAQCQDGVTIANGLLYWWPSVCDCNLTLYGITSLAPAGNFDFAQLARESERLETEEKIDPATISTSRPLRDWSSFRADNIASATTEATVPGKSYRLWQSAAGSEITPTAPTVYEGVVYHGGSDGVIRAWDAITGQRVWTAYTGGCVRYPPTMWQGRALVASGDGWIYCFAAKTGQRLWRFRTAPAERWIPVYGQLLSTWPAASGVLVQDGVAYVAAGIVNYDGTHVYALDAATGRLKWQNNSSGHLDPATLAGVSVQGHMLIHDGKLWLAGGNVVSPGCYDLASGKCLSDVGLVNRVVNNNVPASESPRGSELYLVGDQVMVSGQPHYAHPQYRVYDSSVTDKTWVASRNDRDFTWISNASESKVACYPRVDDKRTERLVTGWGKSRLRGLNPVWEVNSKEIEAVALANNALLVARGPELVALDLQNGRPLWAHMLPGVAVPWGLAVDSAGRTIVTLLGGQIVCFGNVESTASK